MQTAQPEGPAIAQGVEAGPSLGSRFDWYSATLDLDDGARVTDPLARALGATVTHGKGRLGYARCSTIERDDALVCRVFSHSARSGEFHVAVSGDACDEVVPLVRSMWPAHRVARADVALDFRAEFKTVDALALLFAQQRGLSYRLVEDSDGGATRYLGAPSSQLMVRVYKKSEQLRKLHPERASLVPDGIVRAELQARPDSKTKSLVATMEPDELWGLGKWTRNFAASFLDVKVERVVTQFARPSDYARALHWLGVQYGPVVRSRVAESGAESVTRDVLAALGVRVSW